MKITDFRDEGQEWEIRNAAFRERVLEEGLLGDASNRSHYISFISDSMFHLLDDIGENCGLKALASLFHSSPPQRQSDPDKVVESTIIKSSVYRWLVNNVVQVSLHHYCLPSHSIV